LSKLNSAIQFLPELEQLPLVIAGPILRRVQTDVVTVWLALKQPETVRLRVFATESGNGSKLGKKILESQGATVALGKNLHVLAISAKPLGQELLTSGQIYAYDLDFLESDLSLVAAIGNESSGSKISYFKHQLPTFSLPAQDLNHLRIVHGSCRKPHGGGKDTLSYLDNLIRDDATSADRRPQQLFMTGDQIYGDDVADPMLWLCQGISQLLFGWSEELPLESGTISNEELPPGQRTEIARLEGGMTAMFRGKEEKAKSHLFSFGEYAAAYLLAWSPVFVPKIIPDGRSIGQSRQQTKTWQTEIEATKSFLRDLDLVRRALANISVYTICDDHDVSDDFYLNREWCDRVLGKPLGKRTVQNGLLTYALFQAWGNTPEHFTSGTSGDKLLQSASKLLLSEGKDAQARQECDRYLGIPDNDPVTKLPKYRLDEDVLVLARDRETIPWHYTISAASHEVIVLDTRTWRGYPTGKDCKKNPPMLLSPHAFQEQLQKPLNQKDRQVEATTVVLPTNLVALGIIDRIQQYEFSRDRVFSTDVGDSWNFHETAFVTLLLNLCQQRDRVIILSGDIHYSCAVRLVHWDRASQSSSIIVQLTSSAIKNSELSTRIIHTKLKSLLPEKTQRWWGWNKSLEQTKLPQPKWWRKNSSQLRDTNSDWQYYTEWIARQPSESLPWREAKYPQPQMNFPQRIIDFFVKLLWRNRWLQEGTEVVGRNNLSLVRFDWSSTKTVIQETYWHSLWHESKAVKSRYEVQLDDRLQRQNL